MSSQRDKSAMDFSDDSVKAMLKQKYDKDGNGVFDEEEVDDMMGDLMGYMSETKNLRRNSQLLEDDNSKLLRKIQHMGRRTKGLYLLVTILTIGAAIATFFSLNKALQQSNVEVKASIDESVQTKVESDAMGAHHLLDKVSGEELTVRSDGDTFFTTSRFDALTSRKLNCLAISDVAKLVNDVATATPGSLVIKDQDGVEKEILPIGGTYKDDETFLELGSFRVIMDSDACNSALGEPSIIDIAPALDVAAGKDEGGSVNEDKAEDDAPEDEEEGSDIFKRRLRNPSPSIKSSSTSSSRAVASAITPSKRSTILARHRQEFAKARAAIREGRHLTGDSSSVEVQTAGGGSSGTGYTHLGQGRCADDLARYYDRIFRGGAFYDGQNYFNADTCAEWCHNDVDTSSNKEHLRGFQLQYKSTGNILCMCLFDNGRLPSTPTGANANANYNGSGEMGPINAQALNDCYKYVSVPQTLAVDVPLPMAGASCADPYLTLTHAGIDSVMEPLSGSTMDDFHHPDGEQLTLSSFIKNVFYEFNPFQKLSNAAAGKLIEQISQGNRPTASYRTALLLPQKVCADSEDDLPTRAASVDSCSKLDMLNETDVYAFGLYNGHKIYDDPGLEFGYCIAFNDETETYAVGMIGETSILKYISSTTRLEFTAIAISLTKQLSATTLNKMWDGTTSPEESMTVQGHYVMRGTARTEETFGSGGFIGFEMHCDAKMLVDWDYNNGMVEANANDADNYAILLSGSCGPVFVIKEGHRNLFEFDLQAIFNQETDYFQYKYGNYKSLQLATSRNFNLAELCDLSGAFDFFCKMFNLPPDISISIAAHAYANNDGFGLRLAFEAKLELMPGFDIVEDLIGWPDDNQVSASLGATVTNNRFIACVGFQDSEFCQCDGDANCNDDQACDNTFKVCRKKRPNGGKCEKDSACQSGICVGPNPFGFCRECRVRGTATDCDSDNGEVCQSNAMGAPVCGPKKQNGDASGCVSSESCVSGYCVGMDTGLDFLGYDLALKYCRECPTAGSSNGCPGGQFCQRLHGDDVHVCRPKKQNGDISGCSGNDACLSGNCVFTTPVTGFCRVCTHDDHCANGYHCKDDVLTGFIKKCCKWHGFLGTKLSCYTKSQAYVETEVATTIVENGSFEGNVQDSWTSYMSGYTVTTGFKNSGSQSIKVTNGGARQWIQLDAQAGSAITISGYSKAVGTSTGISGYNYSIYADVTYADGSKLWGQKAKFTGGTHAFEYSEKTFTVPKAVDGMSLYALYRNDPTSGVAYFDDVSVTVVSP